mmetsp:Transcript_6973/g.21221  ORF Transcript_6973/g.21221 Transcript_6973/m.21221 type:complete len:571 (+) Transcript_6973:680-2392(+)
MSFCEQILKVRMVCRYVMLHDERGAGFSALGYAKLMRKAAVVITSSGTAVANLLPAVVEASMSKVSLILITADRPPELRDCGAPQTIDQVKIFGSYVRYFHDVQCPTDRVSLQSLLSLLDHAIWHAKSTRNPGPVHLNFMFRENLAPDTQPYDRITPLQNLEDWSRDLERRPLIRIVEPEDPAPVLPVRMSVLKLLQLCGRCLIVAGDGLSPEDQSAVRTLALRLRCPVAPDILSGLRFGKANYPRISYIDMLLSSSDLEITFFQREFVVLQFGERIVSKKLSNLIAKPLARRIVVSPSADRVDEKQNSSMRIVTSVHAFVLSMMELRQLPVLNCFEELTVLSLAVHKILQEIVGAKSKNYLTEPYLAMAMSKFISPHSILFLSNSMPIRDFNTYGNEDNTFQTASNRGANGIDGILSTAIGCALGSTRPVVLVVGDIAFLHDLSAIHSLGEIMRRQEKLNMKIFIVNNYGGAIFSFLPIAKHAMLNNFFTTPHDVNFRLLCQNFRVPYVQITSELELHDFCSHKLNQHGVCVIEATCVNAEKNAKVHRDMALSIVTQIDQLIGAHHLSR